MRERKRAAVGFSGDEPPHRLAHGGELVVLVVDQEARVEPGRARLAPQQPHAEAVEGGHRGPQRPPAQQPLGARAHLLGRLVGERDGQDRVGGDAPVEHQVGDAMGDDAGLAATRPRQDQHWPKGGDDRLALLLVEPRERG
jgi:hypothetical protein